MNESLKTIPKGWQRVRLGDLGNTLGGLTGKNKTHFGQGKSFISYMDVFLNTHLKQNSVSLVSIQDGEKQNKVRYGDYLFTTSSETPEEVGMSSAVTFIPNELYLNSFCFIFRPRKEAVLDPVFGGYLFRGPLFRKAVTTHAKGSTRFNLSKHDFLSVNILFPNSVNEQKRIAEILSAVDEEIKKTDEIIIAAEKLKRGLMQGFFSNKKWSIKKLGEVSEVTTGGTPKTSIPEYWGGEINWMSSGEVNLKRVASTEKTISQKGLENSNAHMLPIGTIMVALAGQGKTRGKVAILEIETTCNQSLAGVIPNKNILYSEFLYYNLEYRYQELRDISGGEGRAGLNLRLIKDFSIPVPPINDQCKMADVLSSIDKIVTANNELMRKLNLLKKGLMQDLLTGRKRTI